MKNKKHAIDKKGDLAKDYELSIAVMNLISIEEHLAFTISKCGKKEYYVFRKVEVMNSPCCDEDEKAGSEILQTERGNIEK